MPNSAIPIGIAKDTPANYYLSTKKQKITFSSEFSSSAVLGVITEQKLLSTIHGQMMSRYQGQKEIPPLSICVKAGNDSFSFLHIIKNNRLIDTHIHHHFKRPTQAEILYIFLKTLFKDINTLYENEKVAIACEHSNYALVVAAKTDYELVPFKNMLCVFFLENDSRLVLITAYTIPDKVFKEIKGNIPSSRYTPINSLQVHVGKNPQAFWQPSTQTNDDVNSNILVSNENNEAPLPTAQSLNTNYNTMNQTFVNASTATNPDTITNHISYPEAVLDDLVEANENTRHIILRNNRFHNKIIQLLDKNIENLSKYEVETKIKEANALIEITKNATPTIKSNINNFDFDIYKDYLDNIKTADDALSNLTKTSVEIIFQINKSSYDAAKSVAKIKKLARSISGNETDEEKEKAIIEKSEIFNEKHDVLVEFTKTIQQKLIQILNEINLLKLEYLKSICIFLNTAINQQFDLDKYSSHCKLYQTFYKDGTLRETCKSMNNSQLYQFFMQLSRKFITKYATLLLQPPSMTISLTNAN